MVAGVAMAHFIAMEARWTAFFGTIDTLGRLAAGAAGVLFKGLFDERFDVGLFVHFADPVVHRFAHGIRNGLGHVVVVDQGVF